MNRKYYKRINNLDIALEKTDHKYIMINQWARDNSMPYKLYKEVEDEIPPEIGVLVAIDRLEPREKEEILDFGIKKTSSWREPIDGLKELYCIKPAIKQELKADKEVILSSMLRSMQRDRIYDLERSNR